MKTMLQNQRKILHDKEEASDHS